MAKHTPGPWVEDGDMIQAEDNTVVAREVLNEADARLIAAAPELLDQLKATLKALVELQNEYGNLSDSQEATLEAASQLYFRLVPEGV